MSKNHNIFLKVLSNLIAAFLILPFLMLLDKIWGHLFGGLYYFENNRLSFSECVKIFFNGYPFLPLHHALFFVT